MAESRPTRPWSALSDADLLRAGGADAFEAFYVRHVDWVLGMLARRTRDPHLAADLCAETFAAALRTRRRFTPRAADGDARSWLFTIALSKHNDALRKGKADDRARRALGMERVVPSDESLARIERLGESAPALALLDELPEDQRDAVRARVLDDRDYDELAGELAVSEAVARKRVSRGLGTLRKRMGREG